MGLDLLLGSNSLLDVTVQEAEGELGVGRVGGADAEPQGVGEDRDDVVPVDDQDGIDEVERLGNGEVVQGDGLVGLDLVQSGGNGGGHVQLQSGAQLRDNLDDLEEGGDHEGGEDDCSGPRKRKHQFQQTSFAKLRPRRAQVGTIGERIDARERYKANANDC